MIYTSSYENCKSPKGVSISGDGGARVGFKGKRIKELAPKFSWWKIWHENIGKIPEDENLAFYIKSYYETVLKPLGPEKVYELVADGTILLCYENAQEFCHRQIAAAYLELFFGQEVIEVIVLENGELQKRPRNGYYDTIKKYLEELIKGSIDMHGCECIVAANLCKHAKFLDENPDLCDILPVSGDSYRRLARVYENEYRTKKM